MQEFLAILTLTGMFCFVIFLNFLFIYLGNKMRRRMIEEDTKKLVQEYMTVHSSEADAESKDQKTPDAPHSEVFNIE